MKIYIDNDYKCHTSPGEGMTEVETAKALLERYGVVSDGGET